jgi:formylglycine-generating enzyme required for sulfatase activity
MRFLGSIELSPLCAELLGEMCEEASQSLRRKSLASSVTIWISNLAKREQYELFAAQYRYLITNLMRLGCFSAEEATVLDPWTKVSDAILTRPAALTGYEMRLVPKCTSKNIRTWAGPKGKCGSKTGDADGPYLIGLHEVTNQDFQRFVEDIQGSGPDWSVEKVTRAGSLGAPQSQYAQMTNEYHLYYWDKDSSGKFKPHGDHLRYPVVYVSWFAALSFCDWLSKKEHREESMNLSVYRGLTVEKSGKSVAPQYRLPTAVEWRWAAQGPFSEAQYPWDLVPYPLPPNSKIELPIWNYRSAARSVALARHGRSKAVAYEDDFSVFGIAGLVGNVKEWVHDTIPADRGGKPLSSALVLGSTAHLDETSFSFEYFANLFPENTNPDIGFRVGRSLSTDELSALDLRQQELATL